MTKYVDVATTKELIAAGAKILGENRIQVAKEKKAAVDADICWQMIGPLQKNKVKLAVKMFDLIQSVDSLALAAEINKQAEKIAKKQKILIQVNIGREEQKHGFLAEDLSEAFKQIKTFKFIETQGLMTIPPYDADPEKTRPYFRKMKEIFDSLASQFSTPSYLSMGMSGDYLVAIEEGANMVRVGSLLFE